MKRIMSLLLAIIMIFTIACINTSQVIAAGTTDTKYEKLQLNVLLKTENGGPLILNAYNVNNQLMISVDDMKKLTLYDGMDQFNSTDFAVIKAKKIISFTTKSKTISIEIENDIESKIIEYELPQRPITIENVTYVPFEDFLAWMDAEYIFHDLGIEVIPNKTTLQDYVLSPDKMDEYYDILFKFGHNVGNEKSRFADIANLADYCDSIYDLASVSVERWNEVYQEATNMFENSSLKDDYVHVIKLMMGDNLIQQDYLNDLLLKESVDNVNKMNWYRGVLSNTYDNIKYYSYEKDFAKFANMYSIMDESEKQLKALGYTTDEIREVFGNPVIRKTIKKGRIIPRSLRINEYTKKVNAHFDLKYFNNTLDATGKTATVVVSCINATDAIQEYFNKNAEKVVTIEDVFLKSSNYPKELREASSQEVNNYKNEFLKGLGVFTTGIYGATKDGQIYDWLGMFVKGATKKPLLQLTALSAFSSFLKDINFFNYKDNEKEIAAVKNTAASFLIQRQIYKEYGRRITDWTDDFSMNKLESLRSPLAVMLLSSQVSYQNLFRYYFSKIEDKHELNIMKYIKGTIPIKDTYTQQEFKNLSDYINITIDPEKKEPDMKFTNRELEVMIYIANKYLDSIKLENYIRELPLPVNNVGTLDRFPIQEYKDFIKEANKPKPVEWKSLYREKLKEILPEYGSLVALIDINLDGTPELLVGYKGGSGGFSEAYSADTIKNGSLISILNKGSDSSFDIEDIDSSKLYYNSSTNKYQIVSESYVQNGAFYRSYSTYIYNLNNDILSQTGVIGRVEDEQTMGNIKYTYMVSGKKTNEKEYTQAKANLYNGWKEVTGFGVALKQVTSSINDINKFLDSYTSSININ